MSDPLPPAPTPSPAPPAPHYSPAPPAGGPSPLGCLLGISLLVNVLAVGVLAIVCLGMLTFRSLGTSSSDIESYHSGSRNALDKIAIVSIDGFILEGFLSHAHKEIEQAARDNRVKAVVLRINSPGGSITASEDLHRRIVRLRDGDEDRDRPAKPVVVSMGSIAASGGYYIAVPGQRIFAEPTTITGSIGVYASFPNVQALGQKLGFTMTTIKAGEIKDSASLFEALPMAPKERQVLQDMVNESYGRFLDVVSKGRKPLTRVKLLERFNVQPLRPDPQDTTQPGPAAPYRRYRADGGAFSASKARELGLIDSVGDLEDAIAAAAELAELESSSYRAVEYHKPKTLTDLLLGQQSRPGPAASLLDADRLQNALRPRIWYLAPGHEAAAFAAAASPPRNP